MNDTRQKLKEMAQLSVFSHRISEIQEKNLKMFPFVFFMGVKSVSIDYDLGHGINEDVKEVNHKSQVSYYLNIGDEENTFIEKRFSALEIAVRELFWKDVKIEVYFNGAKKYESK
jgi:hypothetical protein